MKKKIVTTLAVIMSVSFTSVVPSSIGMPLMVEAAETSSESIVTDTETIKLVQSLLNCIGYDCGTPDGIAGNNTKNAIMEYQKLKGKDATGNITNELILDLYSDVELVIDYGVGTYSDVIDTLYDNNDNCSSASQQAANGSYRAVELLNIIAKQLDKKGKYTGTIATIILDWYNNDSSSTSAVQQEVNGLYTCVKLLNVIALEKDLIGKYSTQIDSVMDSFADVNSSCSSAPQQVANGSYRMTEMLGIIAGIYDLYN